MSCPAVADTVGGWTLLVTDTEANAVQPLVLLVTTRVYVPTALTTGDRVVAPETICPPLEAVHKYAAPGVEPVPLSVVVGCWQVMEGFAGPATAVGGVVLAVTVTKATLVQPWSSVTVTELLPGVVNCAWLVIEPFTHR